MRLPALARRSHALLAVLPLLSACTWQEARFRETRTLSMPWREGQPLAVRTVNGSVEIQRADGTEVHITAELRAVTEDRLKEAQVKAAALGDGGLEISVAWPEGGRKSSEGCSFVIRTPGVRGVDIETGNGAVRLRGGAGDARLRTSNGAVEVSDHDGPLTAATSNGRIVVERVRGAVEAGTSNGSVRVSLTDDNPGPVMIDTSNGSVDLDVGPAFRGTLDLDTSNGSVDLQVPGHVAVRNRKKTSASLDFGPGSASKAESSNGSITVR